MTSKLRTTVVLEIVVLNLKYQFETIENSANDLNKCVHREKEWEKIVSKPKTGNIEHP